MSGEKLEMSGEAKKDIGESYVRKEEKRPGNNLITVSLIEICHIYHFWAKLYV